MSLRVWDVCVTSWRLLDLSACESAVAVSPVGRMTRLTLVCGSGGRLAMIVALFLHWWMTCKGNLSFSNVLKMY